MIISKLHAIEILDSRGLPTISCKITLSDGSIGKGDVPSGASTGDTEVLELRDGDKDRYMGKGVLKAVDIVNTIIAKELIGKNFESQAELDKFLITLDGTPQKEKLGGNSILSVSMAFFEASAKSKGIEMYDYFVENFFTEIFTQKISLPLPMFLIMEGGAHGNWATDFQEYMIIPNKKKFPTYKSMLEAATEVFHATHDLLVLMNYNANVGFEGAYAPKEIKSNNEAFEIIIKGLERAGYKPGDDFTLAIDVASSEFFNKETQKYELKREKLSLTSDEWMSKQKEWYSQYPIFSIEDPFDQEDWVTWSKFTKELGEKYQIVGDDFYTTNVERIKKGMASSATNSVLIKLNQIGTVTETLDAVKLTQNNAWQPVISHRGGETNSSLVADLAVGTNSGMCKFGGPDRGERLAKYNRLLEIEDNLIS